MIQTIVFDFGNVIGYFDYGRAARNLARHTGLAEDYLCQLLFDEELKDDYESGRITSAEFLRRVRARLGIDCADDFLTTIYSDIFWSNDDVCALVPRLKGRYRLLLGSNTTELHAIQFQRQFADTLRHFDGLVFSHAVGVRKPRAEFFGHCHKLADCAVEQCVFIDDLEANIEGARACGWHGIVYRGIADLHERLTALGVHVGAG